MFEHKCEYCEEKITEDDPRPWHVSSSTPAGNFLDLREGEEVMVHDSCLNEITEKLRQD